MRKPLPWIAPLVLLLASAGLAPAFAGATSAAAPAFAPATAAAPAVCLAAPADPAPGQPTAPPAGLAPDPLFATAGTCTVHCLYPGCSRDSDCTALPNGNCAFVCPRVGCCFYP
jgi:hypothetical protein